MNLVKHGWLLAVAIVGGLVVVLKSRTQSTQTSVPTRAGSQFYMLNGVRYWNDSLTPKIIAALGGLDVGVHLGEDGKPSGLERVYTLYTKGKGLKPALQAVRDLQGGGNIVATTTNLLEASNDPKGIAVLLPAEVNAVAKDKEGVAVLPKLP